MPASITLMYTDTNFLKIGMVLFPDLTQLDFTGPYEVFTRMPNVKIYIIAETLTHVRSEKSLTLIPDTTFDATPKLDILFVPGGPGINKTLENDNFLDFLKEQGNVAKYVTSVCTGSLLLAAAGLLDGYKATTHWLSMDLLRLFGVEAINERVVIDGNRITGGGITAGIDFALVIAYELFGEEVTKEIQLGMEYNPCPPFHSGSPETANPELVRLMTESRKAMQQKRKELIERVLAKKVYH